MLCLVVSVSRPVFIVDQINSSGIIFCSIDKKKLIQNGLQKKVFVLESNDDDHHHYDYEMTRLDHETNIDISEFDNRSFNSSL